MCKKYIQVKKKKLRKLSGIEYLNVAQVWKEYMHKCNGIIMKDVAFDMVKMV